MVYQVCFKKSIPRYLIIATCALIFTNCSSESSPEGALIEGKITVDSELDPTGDYSGIELLIADQGPDGQMRDTLFHSVTDSTGNHSGIAEIKDRGLYPIILSRNDNRLGVVRTVLAHGDTVRLNSELPNIDQTTEVQSDENEIYKKFDRLERNFNRVAGYINTRGMSSDSVETEILKWSDLFWDLYEDNKNTFAGEQAAATSVSLLEGWDDDLMLARTDSLLQQYNQLPDYLRNQLTEYYAESENLDRSIEFLDQLESRLPPDEEKLSIRRDRIRMLYDSARTDQARQQLQQFRRTYTDNNMAMEWAESMDYDIETLAPGQPFPGFSFTDTEGNTIDSESFQNPYIIEFTRLDSPLYLEQYDRAAAIHQIYRNSGLRILTIPLSTSDTVYNAFFEERGKMWTFADPGSINSEEIVERYNLKRLPTRFLVDDSGALVQRYVGTEFERVVQGLQKTLTQHQTEQ